MVVDTTPARGRPRDPRRDAAIQDAAVELVAEVGYDRMTIDAIAARAGVSKPTIYRRWPGGKAELIASAIRTRHAEQRADVDTGSLRSDLLAMIDDLLRHVREHSHLAAGLTCQMRESEELAALFREHVIAVERGRFGAVLARAEARGELPAAEAVTPLFADVGPALVHTRLLFTDDPVDAAFVEELVDRVLLPILTFPTPDTCRRRTR